MRTKIIITLLAITAAICCVFGLAACDGSPYTKGLAYSAIEENGEVVAYSVIGKGKAGRSKNINVPPVYKGKPVTTIGKDAFREYTLIFGEKPTEWVSVPEGVTVIGDSAFRRCHALRYVALPDGLVSIGNEAFAECLELHDLTIPASVTVIGEEAFKSCGREDMAITFKGTKAQWNAVKKGKDWDLWTGDYKIHCSDGDLSKPQ